MACDCGSDGLTMHKGGCSILNRKPEAEKKRLEHWEQLDAAVIAPQPEYTGGSVSYYSVRIDAPTSGGDPYTAECNDIIEALKMNYAEGNILKALWRLCAARQGKMKKGYTDGVYDAEKIVFFGERKVVQEKSKK